MNNFILLPISIYLLNLIDLLTTRTLIRKDPLGETNPIMSTMVSANMDLFIKILVVGVVLLSLYFLSKRKNYYKSSKYGLYVLLVVYLVVVINNISVLLFWVF
jgi:hypothetical protein